MNSTDLQTVDGIGHTVLANLQSDVLTLQRTGNTGREVRQASGVELNGFAFIAILDELGNLVLELVPLLVAVVVGVFTAGTGCGIRVGCGGCGLCTKTDSRTECITSSLKCRNGTCNIPRVIGVCQSILEQSELQLKGAVNRLR